LTGKFDVARIKFVDDEKQHKRDEIDELFHSGSQNEDEAA
jgi:hypothetical protein